MDKYEKAKEAIKKTLCSFYGEKDGYRFYAHIFTKNNETAMSKNNDINVFRFVVSNANNKSKLNLLPCMIYKDLLYELKMASRRRAS